MTARSTYESSVAAAAPVRIATNEANANAAQETISNTASGPNGSTSLATGVTLAQDKTTRAANVTYQVAKQTATMTEQATIQQARDTLTATGDVGSR
jgi:hypothetical protein